MYDQYRKRVCKEIITSIMKLTRKLFSVLPLPRRWPSITGILSGGQIVGELFLPPKPIIHSNRQLSLVLSNSISFLRKNDIFRSQFHRYSSALAGLLNSPTHNRRHYYGSIPLWIYVLLYHNLCKSESLVCYPGRQRNKCYL